MWIERTVESTLRRLAKLRPVVVVTGARQTGKTSLVRHVFPKHSFVSLDLPSEAEQAEKEPAAFLARHKRPLIVDEVQYAPGLFRHLKAVVDADRKKNGQFVLTGAQKLSLMRSVSDSLAGRADVMELEGLSFTELSAAGGAVTPLEAMLRGSLPELWEKRDLDATMFHRSYVATYLERDLRLLLRVASLRDFERFLRACALRSAQVLTKADLARDVGISPSTAGERISVLEASNQIFLLEPWFSNRTKSLTKSPKLYLSDTGLLSFLTGIGTLRDLSVSPLAGAIWETFVCGEIRRQMKNGQRTGELFFWRDRVKEIDFLIHRGGRFELYDAKWTEHPDERDLSAILRLESELPPGSVVRKGLVCRAANSYPVSGGAQALPISAL
jgi:uncharacterized protein